jgi:hypothetical protein
VLLGDGDREGDAVRLDDVALVEAERLAEDVANPRVVERDVGAVPLDVVAPLLVRHAQPLAQVGRDVVEPLRERLHQHRHREEWPRHLDQRQPLRVMASDAHARTMVAGTR